MNQIKKWKKINIASTVLFTITFIILFAYIGYLVSIANSSPTSNTMHGNENAFLAVAIVIAVVSFLLNLRLIIIMILSRNKYDKKYKKRLLVAGILMIFFSVFVNFYCCWLFNKMLKDNEINSPTPSDPQNITNPYFYDNN